MGRFRAEAVMVKRIDDLVIVFYDKNSIYIKDRTHDWTVFHRWYTPLGFYGNNWKPFRRSLKVRKKMTFNRCYRLAFQFDISSMSNVKPPNLEGKKVIEIII